MPFYIISLLEFVIKYAERYGDLKEWVRRLFITVLKYQPKSIYLNCVSIDAFCHLPTCRKVAKIEIATV